MDVDGGNTNSHTLTGLTNGQTYTVCIVGTSSEVGAPSAPVLARAVGLGRSVSHNPFQGMFCLFHSSISSSTQ